jgi:transcriptional regulator with XRE-family HTH domain
MGGGLVQSIDISELPKRLKQLRLELGWTLEDMAAAIGAANRGVVSNWEATTDRQRIPPLGTLVALARWYGVSLDYLVGVPGAERDNPMVKAGKAALRSRFPATVRDLKVSTPGARLRLAIEILQKAAPEGFFTARIAANLLHTEESLQRMLETGDVPGPVLDAFARFADMPAQWFYLRPEDI